MRASGPLTAAAMRDIGRQASAEFGRTATGWVFDYSRAVLMATDADLERLVAAVHFDPECRPAAFVANPENAATLQAQAVRLARMGFDRRVFDNAKSAHEWVLWAAATA